MRPTFTRDGSKLRMELTDQESQILRDLATQIRDLLDDPDADDPIHQRLFPRAADDEDVDAELRALVYDDLLTARLTGLEELLSYLDRGRRTRHGLSIRLDEEQAALVLGVLNDLRLALGARAGVESLDRDDIDEDHPHFQLLVIIDHFAWWQEQLLALLDPSSVLHYEDRDETGE